MFSAVSLFIAGRRTNTVRFNASFLQNRKSEFGVGVELNAEGQKLMKIHQDRLGRSLDRLSTELYSKDSHFVLELIQVPFV